MDDLGQDFRFALRALAKNPGFTLVVILTLALGIGANTAIFSLMDQILLRYLPVREPQRLVLLDGPGPFSGSSSSHSDTITPFSHPMYEGLRDKNTVFDGVLGQFSTSVHLTVGKETENVRGDLVSGNFFEVLGLSPAAGRLFTPDDEKTPGGHPVVVLSHGYWMRRFAGADSAVGQTVGVNNESMTIVGVAPKGFHGIEVGEPVDVFVPLMMHARLLPTWPKGLGDWRTRWLMLVARLKDGVSVDQAKAGADVLYRQLLEEDFKTIKTPSERFRTRFFQKTLAFHPGGHGTSVLRDGSRKPLIVLMGMVGLVLLIACANVANLLLARASSRQKEVALRLALGASRLRLVRQFLVESLLLAGLGGLVGVVFAIWTGDLLLRALPFENASRVFSAEPDARVGVFALALSLLTGLLFGLAPALQATRPQVFPTLKNESTAVASGGAATRFRKGLVVAQIALSLLLLIGAGLFTRSLANLRALNPGFEPERLLAFGVNPALNGYPFEQRVALLERVQQDLEAEPGVTSVSLAAEPLMTDSNTSSTVRVEGYEAKDDEDMNPNFNYVGPRFFETLGITRISGRDFTDEDALSAPKVAVVNETFARYFFGDKDPVGRRFALGRRTDDYDFTIVGLVRDGKAGSLREKPLRFVYAPHAQNPRVGAMTFYVRSALDPAALGDRVRAVVTRVDATLPVTDLKTMKAQIRESLFVDRLVAGLAAAFGLVAMALAAIGLYGVMSYAVSLRTREIGIRVALGAERRAVLKMVLGEVAGLTAIGVAIGLPVGFGLGRLVESQLFGIEARDPLTLAAATATLVGAALLAGYLPAARATRVDPVIALRYE
ncbi:MAG TPA: ABC transporter permease [Vicinamibacteria bacterium]